MIFESVPINSMVENDGEIKDSTQEVIGKKNCEMTVRRKDGGCGGEVRKGGFNFEKQSSIVC